MSTDEVTNQVVKVVDAIIEHHARQTIAQNYNKFKQIHTSIQYKFWLAAAYSKLRIFFFDHLNFVVGYE